MTTQPKSESESESAPTIAVAVALDAVARAQELSKSNEQPATLEAALAIVRRAALTDEVFAARVAYALFMAHGLHATPFNQPRLFEIFPEADEDGNPVPDDSRTVVCTYEDLKALRTEFPELRHMPVEITPIQRVREDWDEKYRETDDETVLKPTEAQRAVPRPKWGDPNIFIMAQECEVGLDALATYLHSTEATNPVAEWGRSLFLKLCRVGDQAGVFVWQDAVKALRAELEDE